MTLGETPDATASWKEGFIKSKLPDVIAWVKDNPGKELPEATVDSLKLSAEDFIKGCKSKQACFGRF